MTIGLSIVPSLITVGTSILSLIIIFSIVTYFVYFPTKKNIENRQNFIKKNIDDSIEKNRQADKFLERSEANIKESLDDSKLLFENSKKEADKIKQDLIKKANSDIEKERQELKAANEIELKKLELEFNKKVIDLSFEISKKVVSQKLNEEEEKKLINSFVKELNNESIK